MPRQLPANEHTAHAHTRMLDILSSPIYRLTLASASNRLLSHPSDAPKADAKKRTTNDPHPMGLITIFDTPSPDSDAADSSSVSWLP